MFPSLIPHDSIVTVAYCDTTMLVFFGPRDKLGDRFEGHCDSCGAAFTVIEAAAAEVVESDDGTVGLVLTRGQSGGTIDPTMN